MIITRKSVRIILSLFLALSIFGSCYEETVGCLDLTAANYDAAADSDCIEDDTTPTNCPCTYNELSFNFDFIFQDSLNISFDTAFVNNLGDTLLINSAYFLCSDFTVFGNSGNSYLVQDFADFNNDNILDEVNDVVSVPLSGYNTNVGTLHFSDLVNQATFKLGLPTSLNDATLNFEDNSALEDIVDSMYVNTENQLAFARIELSKINVDTTDYEFNFFNEIDMVEFDFAFDTLIQYHHNFKIELEADIFVLFESVNLEGDNAQDEIAFNFERFIRQKE